ncbi:MAG: arginase [Flavobacteriales bacterium]
MSKNIQFIFNSSELGAGTRGASLGPEAIRAAARAKGSALFSQFKVQKVDDHNDLLDASTPFRFAKYIDGLSTVFASLTEKILDCISHQALPLLISGDHSAAAGTLAALKKAYPQKRIGVIWIDAHADIHSPYTTPSGNIHGMPIAAALGLDHKHLAKNEPDAATSTHWNKLKSNAFLPQDLIYIGVRDTEAEEDAILQELNLRNYAVSELRQKGLNNCLAEMQMQLSACDLIYVSFDVDSIDPEETSFGTGTPVANGLLFAEANAILAHFAKDPRLCALEIVEVNPCLDDQKNKMAEHALELIENIIAQRTV